MSGRADPVYTKFSRHDTNPDEPAFPWVGLHAWGSFRIPTSRALNIRGRNTRSGRIPGFHGFQCGGVGFHRLSASKHETNSPHMLEPGGLGGHGVHGDFSGLGQGVAEDAGRDRREGDGLKLVLFRQLQGAAIAKSPRRSDDPAGSCCLVWNLLDPLRVAL